MKLSRTIAYGVHATIQLAQATTDVPIPASQLAREGHMPERFLVQILRNLVTHGLLHSTCGVSGGYSLARPAAQISLREIVESFDNPLEVAVPALDCMPAAVRSRIMETLQDVAQAARAELQLVSVADLLNWDTKRRHSDVRDRTSPNELGFTLVQSNDYEAQAEDSALIH